ncbi:MAG: HAMP domain-containing sensor histidine kinase [Solirubrobacterales bacterium]
MSRAGDQSGVGARALHATRGVRVRLFAYAALLLLAGIAVTVVTARQILLVRLDSRAEESLVQEVREFRSLTGGTDPRTGRPFGRLEPLFDLYLERNVPTVGEQLITFTGGRFYREKDIDPDGFRLRRRPDLVERWSSLAEPESGQLETPSGPVQFLAVPISAGESRTGTFVVAHFTARERDEVDAAIRTAALVGAIVVLLGSALAFLIAGRVLAPLRELTETARAIEESDLTRRIEVRGDDELAELGLTFNAMLDRVEGAFSSQRNLIRDVGHELRTPITIIRGHLELLDDDPVEREETVELVTDELDRMARLVDDLVTLARAERADFVRPTSIRLGEFASEVLAKATTLGDRRWRLDIREDGEIAGDPQRLTQALVNLVDNAVKQTMDGSTIEIGAALEGEWARLWVADDGPGLSAGDREDIFGRFGRGSSGRRYAGTGLGLAIVQAVATAHGGRVEVDSLPGQGARFTVVVPVRSRSQGSVGGGP